MFIFARGLIGVAAIGLVLLCAGCGRAPAAGTQESKGAAMRSERDPRAELVLEAAREGDATRLRALLAEGASALPHFDPQAARERHRAAMEQVKNAAAKVVADEGLPFEIDMEDYLPKEPTAPYSHDIPLHCAAEAGSAECIRLLIGAGAEVNLLDDSGAAALHYAASAEAVRALVEAGARTDIATEFGRDALDEALERAWGEGEPDPSQLDVAAELVKSGVPLERADENGWSRLTQTAFRENPLGVRFLLEAGHPVRDRGGYTALHSLCWHWDHDDPARDRVFPEIIQMLLDAGLEVDTRDPHGNTALHECVAGDGANAVAARYLLSKGADVNAQNNEGQTPLIYLYDTHFEYEKMVPLLLEHGANPLIRDKTGKNALDHARDRAKGVEPKWRIDQFKEEGREIEADWKEKAKPGDAEHRMLQLMEKAAEKFR